MSISLKFVDGVDVNEQVEVREGSPYSDPKLDGWVWTVIFVCLNCECVCVFGCCFLSTVH